jgi:osmoprotectant transport system permease protein
MVAVDFIDWGWVGEHLDEVWSRFLEHVELTVLAVVIGFVLSLPIAVFCHRHRVAYAPVTWVAGLLYTIPSLALFVLLIPITGLSTTTSEIGLVSYTLLLLIRGVVVGLDSVPDDAKEAARGMGYTDRQLLWRVEMPLALPVIVAAIRIATVTTVGLVTVTALIGKGGEGHFILLGLRTFFSTATYVGAILSVVIAVLFDGLLLLTQRRLTPWAPAGRQRVTV